MAREKGSYKDRLLSVRTKPTQDRDSDFQCPGYEIHLAPDERHETIARCSKNHPHRGEIVEAHYCTCGSKTQAHSLDCGRVDETLRDHGYKNFQMPTDYGEGVERAQQKLDEWAGENGLEARPDESITTHAARCLALMAARSGRSSTMVSSLQEAAGVSQETMQAAIDERHTFDESQRHQTVTEENPDDIPF